MKCVTFQWNSFVGKPSTQHSTCWHFCYICITGNMYDNCLLYAEERMRSSMATRWLDIAWHRLTCLIVWLTNIYVCVINPDVPFCPPCPLLPYFFMVFAQSRWMQFCVGPVNALKAWWAPPESWFCVCQSVSSMADLLGTQSPSVLPLPSHS